MNTNDFRKPTNQERENINKFMLLKRQDSIKLAKLMIYIFTPLTLLMIFSLIIDFNLSIMVLMLLFLVLLIYFLFGYFKLKNEIKLINKFNILVLDCEIYKIETNIETPGCCNVKIKAINGKEYNEYFKVRQENVEVGSRCLLVCKKNSSDVKKGSFAVFTDFMLSEEGLKIRNWGYNL